MTNIPEINKEESTLSVPEEVSNNEISNESQETPEAHIMTNIPEVNKEESTPLVPGELNNNEISTKPETEEVNETHKEESENQEQEETKTMTPNPTIEQIRPQLPPPNVRADLPNSNEKYIKIIKYISLGLLCLIILILILKTIKYDAKLHNIKILTCSNQQFTQGIDIESTYTFKIEAEKIKQTNVETTYNLTNFFDSNTDVITWATEKIAINQNECGINSGCRYSYIHDKGKLLKETIMYNDRASVELLGINTVNSSADEIYNMIKTTYESQMGYRCE